MGKYYINKKEVFIWGRKGNNSVEKRLAELIRLVSEEIGTDTLVLKAAKLGIVKGLRSENLEEQALALKRLVSGNPAAHLTEEEGDWEAFLTVMEEQVVDFLARRTLAAQLESRVAQKMQKHHDDYINQLRLQVLKEHKPNPENAQTLKKLAILERMNSSGLTRSAREVLRPGALEEIVGQQRGIKSLLAKLASPFPQHILIYGPPGVGKTSAARLALEYVKNIEWSAFEKEAPFVEVDGSTLRWDPRDVTNPLLGSVHDPIYQGARRNLADSGVPEPKLGLVTEAHGGVLFLDEIGELDGIFQNKLLKVLEDKRVFFDSAYYDSSDPNVPLYIKKIFEEGAPADFILIGATTHDAGEINPAIRSRCAEVFFEPLTPQDICRIIKNAASKLGVDLEAGVPELLSGYTVEGRKANSILADAYGLSLYRRKPHDEKSKPIITKNDVYEVIQASRLVPYVNVKCSRAGEVGRALALGVRGYLGSIIEIEAVSFQSLKGQGQMRFNDTAGSMAKDSAFNAQTVLKRLTGKDLWSYDLHVNVVGGGRIDGPSAGAAITMAIYSAVTGRPLRQDIAVTGEISLQGRIKAVGGIPEKIFGAKQAGMMKCLIPWENRGDVPKDTEGLQVVPVKNIEEVLEHCLVMV